MGCPASTANDLADAEAGPLFGAVICCTSLNPEQKTRINQTAPQLGAVHQLDLTSETTHLLVGSIDTPKYKYVAKERTDVKVLRPDFLEAVRESWMNGGETDLAFIEAQYRMPVFHDLKVCVTGFEDGKQHPPHQLLWSSTDALAPSEAADGPGQDLQ